MIAERKSRGSSTITRVLGVLLGFLLILSTSEAAHAQARGGARGGGSVRHAGGAKKGSAHGGASTTGRRTSSGGANKGSARGGASTTGRRTSPGGPGRSPGAGPGKPGRSPAARSPGGGGRGRANRADHRYGARKDARRDYYRFRTINHLIRVGARLATRPKQSTTVVVTGTTYYYAGGVYYVQSGSHYVVVSSPPGAVVYAVPTATTIVYAGDTTYYYYGGTYYVATSVPATTPASPETTVNVTVNVQTESGQDAAQADDAVVQSTMVTEDGEEVELPPLVVDNEQNYEVVAPPVGATVPYLPEEADQDTVDGTTYYVFEDTYYQPFASGDDVIYMVVEDPRG